VGELGVLVDAHWLPGFGRALMQLVQRRRRVRGDEGTIVGVARSAVLSSSDIASDGKPVSVLGGEQSNTSLTFGDDVIMKTVRRIEPGISPEVEIGRVLADQARYTIAPPLLGTLEYRRAGMPDATLAVIHAYVHNESDAYSWYRDALARFYDGVLSHPDVEPDPHTVPAHAFDAIDREPPSEFESLAGGILASVELLGRRTAEMHLALASARDAAFVPEPFGALAQRSTYQSMRNAATRTLRELERAEPELPRASAVDARFLVDHGDEILDRLRRILSAPGGMRIRLHGDLHLGQVLSTGRDFVFIDFEGEPALSLGHRRLKRSPMRDLAGMLRSFEYAARTSIPDAAARGQVRSEERAYELLEASAEEWVTWVGGAYLRGYFETLGSSELVPHDHHARRVQLDAHLIEKAMYEVRYELDHRPDWVGIPIVGLERLLAPRVRAVEERV
jgi:maltose alpha-D-glucosyltransferase/alpha-amylase